MTKYRLSVPVLDEVQLGEVIKVLGRHGIEQFAVALLASAIDPAEVFDPPKLDRRGPIPGVPRGPYRSHKKKRHAGHPAMPGGVPIVDEAEAERALAVASGGGKLVSKPYLSPQDMKGKWIPLQKKLRKMILDWPDPNNLSPFRINKAAREHGLPKGYCYDVWQELIAEGLIERLTYKTYRMKALSKATTKGPAE